MDKYTIQLLIEAKEAYHQSREMIETRRNKGLITEREYVDRMADILHNFEIACAKLILCADKE